MTKLIVRLTYISLLCASHAQQPASVAFYILTDINHALNINITSTYKRIQCVNRVICRPDSNYSNGQWVMCTV